MFDFIAGLRNRRIVEIRMRIHRVSFETDETVVRTKLIHILVCVTKVQVPKAKTGIERLRQAKRKYRALALSCIPNDVVAIGRSECGAKSRFARGRDGRWR